MDFSDHIANLLQAVKKRRTALFVLSGCYLTLTWVTGGYLAGNLLTYYYPPAANYWLPFAFLTLLPLGFIFYRYFIRGVLPGLSADEAALLVEAKHPQLNNSLINSWQLSRRLGSATWENRVSFPFIRELIRQTNQAVRGIDAEGVVDGQSLVRSRNWFLGMAGILLIFNFALPDFFVRGYVNFMNPAPTPAGQSGNVISARAAVPLSPRIFSIEDLTLALNFPAYTGHPRKVIPHSDGKIHALPGTEILIEAVVDSPVKGANLVLNENDSFSMTQASPTRVRGEFIAKEPGFYQFQVKDPDGARVLIPTRYPITLEKDQDPRIVLFVLNPKPVYFADHKVQLSYEAYDDYGIGKVTLVIQINNRTVRVLVKNVKGTEREMRENYTWSLLPLNLEAADQVQYYFEIEDNDNIYGPNIGQSEVYSFSVFDERREQENLILLQDELIERMIALLSHSLVGEVRHFSKPHSNTVKLRSFLSSSTDQLINIIGLAQAIQERARKIPSFPQSYLTLLENIVNSLNGIRQDQINALHRLSKAATPIGFNFPPMQTVNGRLITHLEKDLLFLIKINNRQKMDQVLDLKDNITDLAETLKEAFEKAQANKNPINQPGFKAKIEKLKQTLKKIMDKLARQTQALPDEFLNPDAFKRMDLENFNASLERLLDLVNRGKTDEAMKELEQLADDLQTLANQLDQAASSMDELVDIQIMQQIDEALRRIEKLEKEQKNLLEETTQINQSLRERQSEKFEDLLKSFFESLRRDVNAIQSILSSDNRFLEAHPAMKKHNELLETEARLNQKIQDLGQRTLDDEAGRDRWFEEINEARMRLAETSAGLDGLRTALIHRFKTYLPNLSDQYGTLEELTELQDLNEFNSLFKKTFPEILRWMNNLRMSPSVKEDLAGRVENDLRQIAALNSEISKKLGTMNRDLKQDYQSLIGEDTRKEMRQMAGDQKQLRDQTGELTQKFARMNRQNPMISRDLEFKMRGTGNYMKRAENHLQNQRVPESIRSENRALKELGEMRDILKQMKNSNAQNSRQAKQRSMLKLGTGQARDPRKGGSVRMQKEKVDLPSEDQFHVPGEFREDILKAMKNNYPQKYQRLVTEYYKELVK